MGNSPQRWLRCRYSIPSRRHRPATDNRELLRRLNRQQRSPVTIGVGRIAPLEKHHPDIHAVLTYGRTRRHRCCTPARGAQIVRAHCKWKALPSGRCR